MKRREFVKAAGALSLIPLVNLNAIAAERITLDDPTAKALQYVEDATTATRPDRPGAPGSTQICANCMHYADPSAAESGCALFQGKLVPAEAWCAAWVPIPK